MGRAALVLLGVGQAVLLAAALGRVIDPGWQAFGAAGTINGLAMAAIAATSVRDVRGRRGSGVLGGVALAAVAAGLVSAGAWATLGGGTFRLDDAGRAAVLVAGDTVFVAWCVARAMAGAAASRASAVTPVLVLGLRLAAELALLRGIAVPGPPTPAGTTSGLYGIALGAVVIGGWIAIAGWAVGEGLRLDRLSPGER